MTELQMENILDEVFAKVFPNTIKEINGRYTCTECGLEWSACLGDDEIPDECPCNRGGHIIEWADKEREKIEGVGLSDGLVNIITQVIERKMNERFR
tara:strand:+ start:1226 stop:1516 length:291 start_codon:yes stop_codon:yes gene_type:complete